ncbi:hypothetical protein Anapl_04520 [Anas platyrhynchos]|uniref:Uncharacterized protein n=1 Tax=Anas platyrhynchos TaxID=8839 RepID=R0LIN1_ANAPL|nr:hypothetical protein Anapl_04520 [Anas platyrhynchos]
MQQCAGRGCSDRCGVPASCWQLCTIYRKQVALLAFSCAASALAQGYCLEIVVCRLPSQEGISCTAGISHLKQDGCLSPKPRYLYPVPHRSRALCRISQIPQTFMDELLKIMLELQAVKKLHPHNAQVKKASKIVIIAERLNAQAAVTETSLTDTAWVAEDNKFTQDQDGLQVLGEMKCCVTLHSLHPDDHGEFSHILSSCQMCLWVPESCRGGQLYAKTVGAAMPAGCVIPKSSPPALPMAMILTKACLDLGHDLGEEAPIEKSAVLPSKLLHNPSPSPMCESLHPEVKTSSPACSRLSSSPAQPEAGMGHGNDTLPMGEAPGKTSFLKASSHYTGLLGPLALWRQRMARGNVKAGQPSSHCTSLHTGDQLRVVSDSSCCNPASVWGGRRSSCQTLAAAGSSSRGRLPRWSMQCSPEYSSSIVLVPPPDWIHHHGSWLKKQQQNKEITNLLKLNGFRFG